MRVRVSGWGGCGLTHAQAKQRSPRRASPLAARSKQQATRPRRSAAPCETNGDACVLACLSTHHPSQGAANSRRTWPERHLASRSFSEAYLGSSRREQVAGQARARTHTQIDRYTQRETRAHTEKRTDTQARYTGSTRGTYKKTRYPEFIRGALRHGCARGEEHGAFLFTAGPRHPGSRR